MKRPHHVEKIAFVPLAESPKQLGILGTGVARVDGVGVGPLLVMRHADGTVHTCYVAPFESLAIPACLLDADVRARIELLVSRAMRDWVTRR